MGQKCKTPARLVALIESHNTHIDYLTDVLFTKAHTALENQADFVKEHGAEYFEGIATGISQLLETALFDAHCYAGFHYVGEKKFQRSNDGTVSYYHEGVGPQHPEYREWRRHYYTRG